MGEFDWNDPDFESTGDYVKWLAHGEKVTGLVTEMTKGEDFNGDPCPVLLIDTGGGEIRTLRAGQVNLKRKLKEAGPSVGDRIEVLYVKDDPEYRNMKVFTVTTSKPPTGDVV